jgi:hypothetical protein
MQGSQRKKVSSGERDERLLPRPTTVYSHWSADTDSST